MVRRLRIGLLAALCGAGAVAGLGFAEEPAPPRAMTEPLQLVIAPEKASYDAVSGAEGGRVPTVPGT